MTVKGVIFDLDGTLLDSMYIWSTIGEEYLLSRRITPEKGLNEKFKNMSIVQAAEYYRSEYGLTDSVEVIIKGVNSMIDHLYSNVVIAKDGVLNVLERFKEDGVRMCIATATDRYMVEAALKHNKIEKYFCGILTCTEVGSGKDKPVIFEKALELLGTKKSETLVFEDALHAVETAKDSGFTVVGIFDKSSKADQSRIKEICDYYIASYHDWSKIYD